MNTHLKQLWAAMKLPKNFKKSYKFFCLGLDIRVTELLTMIGIENATKAVTALLIFISACAFLTSLVTEGLKCIKKIDSLPTKLVCYIVAIVLTTPVMCAMMAFMKMPIEWYMVFGSFLASFVVAKVSMSGWDDVNELFDRLFRTK